MQTTKFENIAGYFRNSAWLKIGQVAIMFVASAWLVYSMFHTTLKSRWSYVDDQEIAYYLGSDQRIELSEAWNIYINETEIGKYGEYARFRPAYFAFRLLESWLWNRRLILWYSTGLAIFTVFLGVFWYLSAEKIGFLIGGLITFSVAMPYYWIDIFARLGPSEPYAVFGLTMFGLGVYFLYRPWKLGMSWFLICTGTMIMTGSKENFFPILILLAFIAYDNFKKNRVNLWGWLFLSLTVLWNVWILSAIVIAVGKTGKDIYQQSVDFSGKTSILLNALKRWEVMTLLGLCLIFLMAGILTRKRAGQFSRLSVTLGLSLAFLLTVYITQFIIYNGDFPNKDRYDFPGLLTGPLSAVLMIWYFQQVARLGKYRSYTIIVFVIALLACATVAYSQVRGIRLAQRESLRHVRVTNKFTDDVLKLKSLIEQYPGYTLIFQANTPIDDTLFAFIYNPFLRYYGVTNPMSVLWAGGSPEAYSGPDVSFIHNLQKASLYGGTALTNVPLKPDFVPLSQADGKKCVLILISSTQPAKECLVVYDWEN